MNIKMKCAAFAGILTMLLSGLTVPIAAQKTPRAAGPKIVSVAPGVTAALTDSFADANGDGKAAPGETVTYSATVTNSGTSAAANVVYSSAVDQNSAYVTNSASARNDAVDGSLIYYTFNTGGGTDGATSAYKTSAYKAGGYNSTDDNLNTVFGGQNDFVSFMTSNVSYNAGTGIFRFDGALQNLLPNALGTLDGSRLDAAGVQMIVQKITVNSGSGTVTPINPSSFRYDQIIGQDQTTAPKTFQFNVPNTVASFTVGFLVSTKVQLMLVINEVLVNPGDPITDANGEWFELYNAGRLPVNLQNFLINDSGPPLGTPGEECFEVDSSRCYRPPFTVGTSLPIASGAYLVFGNTKDTALNGGVPVDYAYGSAMNLVNSIDSIRIRTPAATGALKIDKTQYAQAGISAKNGISRELKNPALDNANLDGSNWADASVMSVYGSGGRGTPKAQNSTYTPFWAGNETTPEKSDALFAVGANGKNDAAGAARSAPLAGETVTVNLGTIPAGESVVVTYQVTIANPLPAGTTEISTQGTVSGDNFASVMTDDPATGAANDATATPVQAIEPKYSIAGTIKYGTTNVGQPDSFVSGVNLNATGTAAASAISDGAGVYQLSNLAAGNYTVTPTKTGEIKGINSLDATRIQQHRVGLITLTANQLIAADTDGSGAVNSLDATRIQQRAVGITAQNIIGQWKFVPGSKQYNSISSDAAGENYEAVLVGEVSGNWATASSFADDSQTEEEIPAKQHNQSDVAGSFEQELSKTIAERMKQSAASRSSESKSESAMMGASVAVSLPANASATTGTSITVPVTIGAVPAGSPIESFDFTVFYDPAVLQPASPAGSNAGTLSANCSVLANSPQTGRVVVSGACAQAITTVSGGVLYNLQFNVIGTSGQQTGLLFNNPSTGINPFMFNSGNPAANTTNGSFSVLPGPTAASVTVSGRVTNNQGRGIRNVVITMIDSNGNERTATSTAFGYYRFDDVVVGETITLSAKARRFRFDQSTIVRTTNDSITNADFVSER